jgi:hypothetical protein
VLVGDHGFRKMENPKAPDLGYKPINSSCSTGGKCDIYVFNYNHNFSFHSLLAFVVPRCKELENIATNDITKEEKYFRSNQN